MAPSLFIQKLQNQFCHISKVIEILITFFIVDFITAKSQKPFNQTINYHFFFFFNDLISECTQTPTEEMKRAGTELIRTLRSIGQPYMTLVFVVKQVTNYELHQLWIKQSSSIMAPHTLNLKYWLWHFICFFFLFQMSHFSVINFLFLQPFDH